MSKSYTVGPITAYAIAVKHGYSGSETEWLASLKGATGPQGPKGDSYNLTAADKQEIAQTVLHEMPTWDGGSY